MKFSTVLAFAGMAMASPFVQPVVRADEPTVVGTIKDTIDALIEAGEKDLEQIVKVIDTFANATGTSIHDGLEIIKHDFEEISEAVGQATKIIAEESAKAAEIIKDGVEKLTQEEIEILAEAVKVGSQFVKDVEAVIAHVFQVAGQDAKKIIDAEIKALEAALKPFVKPLLGLLDIFKQVGKAIGLEITVLVKAGEAFTGVLLHLLKTLGIDLLPHPK